MYNVMVNLLSYFLFIGHLGFLFVLTVSSVTVIIFIYKRLFAFLIVSLDFQRWNYKVEVLTFFQAHDTYSQIAFLKDAHICMPTSPVSPAPCMLVPLGRISSTKSLQI